jgi:hypothetical protein
MSRSHRKNRQTKAPSALGRWARNKRTADHLNTSVMTLWRWKHDESLNFPLARIVNGIEYNDLDEIDAWMRARPARPRGRPSKAQTEEGAATVTI